MYRINVPVIAKGPRSRQRKGIEHLDTSESNKYFNLEGKMKIYYTMAEQFWSSELRQEGLNSYSGPQKSIV